MMRPGAMERRAWTPGNHRKLTGAGRSSPPGTSGRGRGDSAGELPTPGPPRGVRCEGWTGRMGGPRRRTRTTSRLVTEIPEVARRAAGAGGSGPGRREPAWSWEGDGSRYRLEGHRPSLVIIVGWDRPLATYFLQVWDVPASAEDHEEGELLLWGGTAWGELRGIGDLAHALSPFAALPRGLAARLLAERMASPAGGRR